MFGYSRVEQGIVVRLLRLCSTNPTKNGLKSIRKLLPALTIKVYNFTAKTIRWASIAVLLDTPFEYVSNTNEC